MSWFIWMIAACITLSAIAMYYVGEDIDDPWEEEGL